MAIDISAERRVVARRADAGRVVLKPAYIERAAEFWIDLQFHMRSIALDGAGKQLSISMPCHARPAVGFDHPVALGNLVVSGDRRRRGVLKQLIAIDLPVNCERHLLFARDLNYVVDDAVDFDHPIAAALRAAE